MRVQSLHVLLVKISLVDVALVIGVKWYLVGLSCISLMANNVEHLFMWPVAF